MNDTLKDAHELFRRGTEVFARIEADGLRMDTDYMARARAELDAEADSLAARLRDHPLHAVWKAHSGDAMKLNSRAQLVAVLDSQGFDLGTQRTTTGKVKADEAVLARLDSPFVKDWMRLQKVQKARDTYLAGLVQETCDGYLHPSFNLNTVWSFRSSSSGINFQNIPVRSKWMKQLIRRCFISRPGHRMIEVDFSGMEVRAACFYHKDPTMMTYLNDTRLDLHREMAAEIYLLDEADVSKEARYSAKNGFVFPSFYGSYYAQIAPNMWENVEKLKLTGPGGIPLYDHLASKGVTSLGACDPKQRPRRGSFEYHVREVEERFWNERFPTYKKWKDDWYAAYLRTGGFTMLTGFRISGLLSRNQVINAPVQGVGFHCLLYGLIRLQEKITKNRMRAKIVGQIHDSIVGDVPDEETQDYLGMAEESLTDDVKARWRWVNVPLPIEAEVTPVGGSWYEKEEWSKNRAGRWRPKVRKEAAA